MEDGSVDPHAALGLPSVDVWRLSSRSISAAEGGGPPRLPADAAWTRVSFPSSYDPCWRAAHRGRVACVVTTEADDEWLKLAGLAASERTSAALDARRAQLHEVVWLESMWHIRSGSLKH